MAIEAPLTMVFGGRAVRTRENIAPTDGGAAGG